ncbi:MAG: 2-oxoacid:acceptor oxidoreductase family protein [Desulfobacteraceae bacterium]|jgi:pyruvate ferredoxin oxidoreductase gamma subunit/2-oxoisovalerate ferredoxin oxidoreductase gamma subunit|nr:2-oxoacid:acceptor oxidoreductase family protein [Desulfobacteraceae bacterium]
MQEIRFHGRGGQGTVLASISLAKAFFEAGWEVQTFPLFGVERRGAPVEAYLRIAHEKIYLRSGVYNPDHIVVMDAKLIGAIDVTRGLKPGGWILVNSAVQPHIDATAGGFRLAWVDATGIAVANRLGTRTHPIINTAVLGAFARTFGMPELGHIEAAVRQEVPVKKEENVAAARAAYDQVHFLKGEEA